MNGTDFLVDTNFLIHVHEGNPIVEPFLDYGFATSFTTEIELLGVFSISKPSKNGNGKVVFDLFIEKKWMY